MKTKIILFFILFFIISASENTWEKEILQNEYGNEVISYTKKINNYKFTYNVSEIDEVATLLIENKLYKYRIAKGKYDDEILFFYIKYDANYESIDITKTAFLIEINDLKIKERLLKYDDEITRKVIQLLDDMK